MRTWDGATRLVRRRQGGIDAVIAAVLAASWWWELAHDRGGPDLALTSVLAALATLPVALRTRFPRSCFGVSAAALTAVLLVGNPVGATAVGVAFVAYSVITVDEGSVLVPVVGACAALTALSWWRLPVGDVQSVALDVLLVVALLVVAEAARTRRRTLRPAARARGARGARAGRRPAACRRRRADSIARELHDVVAHSMSQISVQAGMGRMLAASQPQRAVDSLAAIERLSRETLAQMRSFTGALRDPADGGRRPQPGVDDLGELLAGVRQSGVRAALSVTGDPRPLPPTLGRAVYRIVQESLTNVVKHAGPSVAAVACAWTPTGCASPSPTTDPSAGGPRCVGLVARARHHRHAGARADPRRGAERWTPRWPASAWSVDIPVTVGAR